MPGSEETDRDAATLSIAAHRVYPGDGVAFHPESDLIHWNDAIPDAPAGGYLAAPLATVWSAYAARGGSRGSSSSGSSRPT